MDITQVELIILAALGATFTWGTTAFLSLDCTFFVPFIASWVLGAVLGDYKTGLIVGATIQTINMAPVMVGGMTAMDIWGATAICVPLVIRGGMDLSTALTIAAPIAVLYNILGTLVGVVWLDGVCVGIVDKFCRKGDWKSMFIFNTFIAGIPKWLVLFVTCYIAISSGSAITAAVSSFPAWVTTGIATAAGLLPAVGFALFLHVIGNIKYLPYFFIGYYLVWFFGMSNMLVGILGVVVGIIYLQIHNEIEQGGF